MDINSTTPEQVSHIALDNLRAIAAHYGITADEDPAFTPSTAARAPTGAAGKAKGKAARPGAAPASAAADQSQTDEAGSAGERDATFDLFERADA